ncbi:hypothetical protein LTR48_008392, partial [Friedmanniomyces endolithicus]
QFCTSESSTGTSTDYYIGTSTVNSYSIGDTSKSGSSNVQIANFIGQTMVIAAARQQQQQQQQPPQQQQQQQQQPQQQPPQQQQPQPQPQQQPPRSYRDAAQRGPSQSRGRR